MSLTASLRPKAPLSSQSAVHEQWALAALSVPSRSGHAAPFNGILSELPSGATAEDVTPYLRALDTQLAISQQHLTHSIASNARAFSALSRIGSAAGHLTAAVNAAEDLLGLTFELTRLTDDPPPAPAPAPAPSSASASASVALRRPNALIARGCFAQATAELASIERSLYTSGAPPTPELAATRARIAAACAADALLRLPPTLTPKDCGFTPTDITKLFLEPKSAVISQNLEARMLSPSVTASGAFAPGVEELWVQISFIGDFVELMCKRYNLGLVEEAEPYPRIIRLSDELRVWTFNSVSNAISTFAKAATAAARAASGGAGGLGGAARRALTAVLTVQRLLDFRTPGGYGAADVAPGIQQMAGELLALWTQRACTAASVGCIPAHDAVEATQTLEGLVAAAAAAGAPVPVGAGTAEYLEECLSGGVVSEYEIPVKTHFSSSLVNLLAHVSSLYDITASFFKFNNGFLTKEISALALQSVKKIVLYYAQTVSDTLSQKSGAPDPQIITSIAAPTLLLQLLPPHVLAAGPADFRALLATTAQLRQASVRLIFKRRAQAVVTKKMQIIAQTKAFINAVPCDRNMHKISLYINKFCGQLSAVGAGACGELVQLLVRDVLDVIGASSVWSEIPSWTEQARMAIAGDVTLISALADVPAAPPALRRTAQRLRERALGLVSPQKTQKLMMVVNACLQETESLNF